MDNQLAILIKQYEDEKANLEAFIKECLNDFDGPGYLFAHHYQSALYKVQETLRVLYHYRDPLSDERQRLSSITSWMEKEGERANLIFPNRSLEVEKAKLEKLNSPLPKTLGSNEENSLDNALKDLVNKRLKKFKLVLHKSKNFYLEFQWSAKNIKVSIPNMKRLLKQEVLYPYDLSSLTNIGFKEISKNKWQVSFCNEGERTIETIRFLLVKLLFEILFLRFTRDSYIEFVK